MATKVKKDSKKQVKQTPTKKLTASQRIEMLENLVLQFSNRFNLLAEEIDKLRNVSQTLNKKLTASITATDSEDSVKAIIVKKNLEELEGRVKFLEDRGVLVRNDDMTIVDKSFIVGRDIDENGKEVNPRVQFSVESLPQDLKDTILGKKLGEMVKPEGAETSLEILEIYEIKEIDVNQQFTPEETSEGPEAPVKPPVKAKEKEVVAKA